MTADGTLLEHMWASRQHSADWAPSPPPPHLGPVPCLSIYVHTQILYTGLSMHSLVTKHDQSSNLIHIFGNLDPFFMRLAYSI